MEGVVGVREQPQRGARAEPLGERPQQRNVGQRVARALQEQQGYLHVGQVLGAFIRRVASGVERKAEEGEAAHPGRAPAACACDVMRPPNDLPPATSDKRGSRRPAAATAARTVAWASAGGSGRFVLCSMYGNW